MKHFFEWWTNENPHRPKSPGGIETIFIFVDVTVKTSKLCDYFGFNLAWIAWFLHGFLPDLHGRLISVTFSKRTASHLKPHDLKTIDRDKITRPRNYCRQVLVDMLILIFRIIHMWERACQGLWNCKTTDNATCSQIYDYYCICEKINLMIIKLTLNWICCI